jgi:eukaryotic-like serine/threonine-protein kinase
MTAALQRRTLGRYELLEPIGRGSATESFRAKSFGVEGFEKTLVVKRVLPDLARHEAFLAPFLEHVQRAMRLSHANLSQVFDLGRTEEDGGAYFLATEYVAGVDVATLLERCQGTLAVPPVSVCAYVALEVAKALDHAHRRRDEQLRPLGIVHGAVAPHNVLVSFDGDVKLTDFGITRALLALPRPREALSRLYAATSPEQADGAEPTPASDIFSLGTLLYFLLTGVSPFAGSTAAETLRRVSVGALPPVDALRPDVPAPFAELLHRALSREPGDRFPSVSSLYEELLACVYACGLRCSASELAAFVDLHREAPATIPTEAIDALLSRPLTLPPPLPDAEAELSSDEGATAQLSSVPPLTGFGELRHVSALVLELRQRGALPDFLRSRMHATLDRYGGVVVSETPTEVVALFGMDRSDGRDTEAAVRCGLVLVRALDVADVSPSAGIDAGRMRLGPDLRPVSDERTTRLVAAARSLAEEVEQFVRVSRRLGSMLRGRFPLEPLGAGFRVTEFAQDGFSESFVGRKAELQHLGETLVRAARGELRLLGIVGGPGIGKTRLAVEMVRRLSRGSIDLRTYFATCPPRGREVPYSGIVAMLRRVCGVRDGDPASRIEALEPRLRALGLDTDEVAAVLSELGAAGVGGGVSTSTALRSAVLRMMHSLAEDRFTVFVWDDAHELDAASSELLARVATRLAGSRLALVVCARPEPGAPYEGLQVHAELRLGEMDPQDVERLVAQRVGVEQVPTALLDFLRDRAGGQPMFLEELISQLNDTGAIRVEQGQVTALALDDVVQVPRTLRALTADRLRRLSDDERHLFVAAAVLEPPAPAELLARMLGLPVPVVHSFVESLIARGLMSFDGADAFGFPSPLAREVVLAELDAEDLAALHRRAAEAHVALLGPQLDDEADRAGYHLAAAGDRDAAAEMYARGGLHALGQRQLDRAALDLAYALDLSNLEHRSGGQIGNWLRALSTAVRYVRSGPTLPALIERLVQRAQGEGMDLVLRAQMRIDLARILGALDQELAGEALLDGGASESPPNPEIVTSFLAAHAELSSGRGEFRLARRALDPLARMVVPDKEELHRITLSMARTLGAAGKIDAAEAALEDAGKLGAREDPLLSLDRAAARTALCASAGRFRDAAEAAVQAASQAEELGLVYEVASSLSDQAVALARSGDLSRARAAVASAFNAAEEIGAERVLARCELVLCYLEGADARSALGAQREHVALVESRGWISDALLGRYLLGRMATRLGALDEARQELLLGSRIAASTGNHAYADQFSSELAKLG